jgi:hypothetical protein
MKEPSINQKLKYSDEWILVSKGKIIKHDKDVRVILEASEDCPGDCYIEMVLEGQVCFY